MVVVVVVVVMVAVAAVATAVCMVPMGTYAVGCVSKQPHLKPVGQCDSCSHPTRQTFSVALMQAAMSRECELNKRDTSIPAFCSTAVIGDSNFIYLLFCANQINFV